MLLATVATLAGTSIAVGAYQGAGDPGTVVQAYFAALSSGDAAGALGYGDLPSGRHDLLTSAMLAAQNATAPIGNVTIGQVRRSANNALVNISYTLAFSSGKATVLDAIPLSRRGHYWRLTRSAVPLSINPGNGSTLANFAGSQIPSGDYAMFPGAVPVTYDTPNLELDPFSRFVHFAGNGNLQVNAQVSAVGKKVITPVVRAALTACLAGEDKAETLCPLPDLDVGVPGSLRGIATGQTTGPVLLLVEGPSGKIDITEEAAVNATYQKLDENNLASPTTVDSVNVHAHCFATVPGTIIWDEAS